MGRLSLLPGAADGGELTLAVLDEFAIWVLQRLSDAGHEAALVGGSLRDALAGEALHDWDVATSARPEKVAMLFPDTTWANRFGTVTVHGAREAQVTTYRAEGGYSDRRRPQEVRFGVSLADDLSRRDFTINAMAWVPTELAERRGRLLDPYGGIGDLRERVLRAVGDPAQRIDEDALRLLRAVRFAHRYGLSIAADTEAAIRRLARNATEVSGERARDELLRILRSDAPPRGAPAPSAAFLLMERVGLLAVLLPELVALRGVPQDKAVAGDALDHTLRAVDAVHPDHELARVTALLHDIGKASTQADGHFIGHETAGAELAEGVMRRLRFPARDVEEAVHAIRHHMYAYDSSWTDAAVRRFTRRIGPGRMGLLFELRRADNEASGVSGAGLANQRELEQRMRTALNQPLDVAQLALDGHDLQRELGLAPGPAIGRLLDQLTEAVLDDPSRNQREELLRLAREAVAER